MFASLHRLDDVGTTIEGIHAVGDVSRSNKWVTEKLWVTFSNVDGEACDVP